MVYPCIVYKKTNKMRHYGNNIIYLSQTEYQITVIDKNPDSTIADVMETQFEHCIIDQYFTMDNLNHTTLTLYY